MRRFLAARTVRNTIQKTLKSYSTDLPSLRLRFSEQNDVAYDVGIERTDTGFDIILSNQVAGESEDLFPVIAKRLSAMVYWWMQAPQSVQSIVVHLSDGDHWTNGGFLFATCNPEKTPLPDLYFFKERGFADLRSMAPQSDVSWENRSADLVWRGGPNGNGYFNVFPELAAHPATRQRIRMAWKCQSTEIDFGFPLGKESEFYPSIKAAGMLRQRIEHSAWFGKKYAIDIDGFSNSWDNLFHRMLMGCCVLKVQSDFGFRQWYYHKLNAWEHYVPVRADLSDLEEKVAWMRDNDGQARDIAANSRALALAMTFESESKVAGRLIEENWQRHL